MKLLLVEDEHAMGRLLLRGLQEEGHQVDLCETAAAAQEQAFTIPYDVVVLDWGLPDLDGLSLLRDWRRRGMSAPVLMLTARGTAQEKIAGLREGADDYLSKPFDFGELLARLEAVHRRGGGIERARTVGSLVLDARRRIVERAGRSERLTAREFALISELAGHVGEVLSRARLLNAAWGPDFEGTTNVVDVYIGYLRQKLARLDASDVRIESVRGVGYRLLVAEPQ